MKAIKRTPGEPTMAKQLEAVKFYRAEAEQRGLKGKAISRYANEKLREWVQKCIRNHQQRAS